MFSTHLKKNKKTKTRWTGCKDHVSIVSLRWRHNWKKMCGIMYDDLMGCFFWFRDQSKINWRKVSLLTQVCTVYDFIIGSWETSLSLSCFFLRKREETNDARPRLLDRPCWTSHLFVYAQTDTVSHCSADGRGNGRIQVGSVLCDMLARWLGELHTVRSIARVGGSMVTQI